MSLMTHPREGKLVSTACNKEGVMNWEVCMGGCIDSDYSNMTHMTIIHDIL